MSDELNSSTKTKTVRCITYFTNDNFLSFYRILGEKEVDDWFAKREAMGIEVIVLIDKNKELPWRDAKAYYYSIINSFKKK